MSKIKAGTTTTTAYQVEADTTGALVLQTGATPTTALTLGTDQSATFAGAVNAPNTFGFKNRIINGAMMIDQRNAGATVTINSAAWTYAVDRWTFFGQATDGVYTVQQSSTAPAGFTKSAVVTVTTADASIGATQLYLMRQSIEGLNVADFGWGTANAQPVTISFWVRSSVTGTFGGYIQNDSSDRSYPFTYTISSANTFEQKTVTIAGDTSGTWLTTNGQGLILGFQFGAGSSRIGTAGSWAAAGYYGATGATNLIATTGATFYITGVQLEKGSTATSFDYRPYGTELALCQRYYTNSFAGTLGAYYTTVSWVAYPRFPVPMRAAPTLSLSTGTTISLDYVGVGSPTVTPNSDSATVLGIRVYGSPSSTAVIGAPAAITSTTLQASAEL